MLNDLKKLGYVHVRRETLEDGQIRGCMSVLLLIASHEYHQIHPTGFQVGSMPSLEQLAAIHQAQLEKQRTHRVRLAKQRINNAMNRAW